MAIRASDHASSTGRLRLTVDDAGLDGQLLDRGRHEREAVGEIMAVSGDQPERWRPRRCARMRNPSW